MHKYAFIKCIFAIWSVKLNWEQLKYFLEVHRQGSLKNAAKKLKVNQTTVGRNLTNLEESIGTHLFERRPDGFILTAAGERILSSLQSVEEQILNIERTLAGEEEKPEGSVKIAMPGALANHWLIPLITTLLDQYPKLSLEFLTGPEVLNLTRREADLALRLVRPQQQELVSKKMGSLKLILAGHKSLFKSQGKPKTIVDLKNFRFIGLYDSATSQSEKNLLQKLREHIHASLYSAAWSSVYSAVSSGLGIGILPSFMLQKNNSLIELLPDYQVSMPLWLVYHPDLRHAKRVRVVIDFLQEQLRVL